MNKKDYTYLDNKFVDSSKINFSREYLTKRRATKIVKIIFAIIVFVIASAGLYYVTMNKAYVGDILYYVDKDNHINIGDDVAFASTIDWYDNVLFTLELKDSAMGNVVTLPSGLYIHENGQSKILSGNEYAVECVSGNCAKGNMYLIKKENIYGIVTGETPFEKILRFYN